MVILVSCPDAKGLVSATTTTITSLGANIVHAEQALNAPSGMFFQRVACSFPAPTTRQEIKAALKPTIDRFSMSVDVRDPQQKLKTAVFCSQELHCLFDTLSRHHEKDLPIDVRLVVSDRSEGAGVAAMFNIPFLYAPTGNDRRAQEDFVSEHLEEQGIELIVLARYMKILTPQFVSKYPDCIINIHHSFLPSFIGMNPYGQAEKRGVKLIGATSHYVVDELDGGPIIEQDVVRVTHLDDVSTMRRKGADVERVVLARAIRAHAEHRILVWNNKTVVFN